MVKTLFFDTYAFFELLNGNADYDAYKKNVAVITTKLNLMELHFGLLKKYGLQIANERYNRFLPFVVDFSDEHIFKANQLKYKHQKKYLSFVDCLGYVIALQYGCKFLTGDNAFEHIDNVEFVK